MSDSAKKYEELVEEGKIKPGKTKVSLLSETLLSQKEKNVINLIRLCRTVHMHELDFEVANTAVNALQKNPSLSELEAIQIAMGEWDIL